mmetsp:Transcript_75070/g.217902  ORF Transcript_75070/g.217902 Transcript_75070/m.217902 type:complete len:1001 (+) Transcript_75070:1680-4682(+)
MNKEKDEDRRPELVDRPEDDETTKGPALLDILIGVPPLAAVLAAPRHGPWPEDRRQEEPCEKEEDVGAEVLPARQSAELEGVPSHVGARRQHHRGHHQEDHDARQDGEAIPIIEDQFRDGQAGNPFALVGDDLEPRSLNDRLDMHDVPQDVGNCPDNDEAEADLVEVDGIVVEQVVQGMHLQSVHLHRAHRGQQQASQVEVEHVAAGLGDAVPPSEATVAVVDIAGEGNDRLGKEEDDRRGVRLSVVVPARRADEAAQGRAHVAIATAATTTAARRRHLNRLHQVHAFFRVDRQLRLLPLRGTLPCLLQFLLVLFPLLLLPSHARVEARQAQEERPVPLGKGVRERVRVSVHGASNHHRHADRGEASQHNRADLPSAHVLHAHLDARLLGAVRVVVVPGAREVVRAHDLHLHEAGVEVGGRGVELVAVGVVVVIQIPVLDLLLVLRASVARLCGELRLIQEGELLHEPHSLLCIRGTRVRVLRVEEERVALDGHWLVPRPAADLDQIGAIGALPPIARIPIRVRVAADPLEVHVVAHVHLQVVRHEVVLNSGVHLHNVPAPATNVKVDDPGVAHHAVRPLLDDEHVGAVLEGSAELGCVHLDLQGPRALSEADKVVLRVVLQDGLVRIVLCIEVEKGVPWPQLQQLRGLRVLLEVPGGHVVAHTQDAEVAVRNGVRNDPHVGSHLAIRDVAVVVVSALRQRQALGWVDAPRGLVLPCAAPRHALLLVIRHLIFRLQGRLGIGTEVQLAVPLLHDVLGLPPVELAMLRLRRHDGGITPTCRVPIRVIVALLRALQTSSVAVVVLPGCRGADVVIQVAVRGVEALVPLPLPASVVILEGLVAPALKVIGSLAVRPLRVPLVPARGAAPARVQVAAVAKPGLRFVGLHVGIAHVLDDQLALRVRARVSATVLRGPLELQLRAVVEVHRTLLRALLRVGVVVACVLAIRHAIVANHVPASGVVLRVEQAVLVLGVVRLLRQPVVRPARILHVEVTRDAHHCSEG